jgi:hypothetical protein
MNTLDWKAICRMMAVACALTCGLLPGTEAPAAELVGIYLTWQRDPTSTMTINWLDDDAVGGDKVWYRRCGGWNTAKGSHHTLADTQMTVHRVELSHLWSGTCYEFVIPSHGSTVHRFRTIPRHGWMPLRFVVGGDMYNSGHPKLMDEMNRHAGTHNPHFALLGGDLAYSNAVKPEKWYHWLRSWTRNAVTCDGNRIPMVLAIGNHEVTKPGFGKEPKDAPYFYSLFAMPGGKSYYTLDFGKGVSVIALDSDHTNRIEGEQRKWLDQALAQRAHVRHKFVVYHHPAYGSNIKNWIDPSQRPIAKRIRKEWCPLFEKYHVSAVFENHDHTYKRSKLIRADKVDPLNGILYMGDGCWGRPPNRPVPGPGELWYLERAEKMQNLVRVTVHGNRCTYEAFGRGMVGGQVTGPIQCFDRYVQMSDQQPRARLQALGYTEN